MPLNYFSNTKSWDAENKHDTEGGTWPQAMCPHTLKKKPKPFAKSSKTKQSRKSSYTIPKGPLKRQGERAKAKTNASQSKITSMSRWKSSTKGGKSTLASGWRRRRSHKVCSKLMCVLLEHTPLHEQRFMRNVVVLLEVGQDLKSTPKIFEKLKQVF